MSDFFEAAVPEPYTVLGLNLKPLSPGHLILLHKVESPFICGGLPTLDALVMAIWICHLDYKEALTSLTDPATKEKIAAWQKEIGAFSFVKKAALFFEYIKEGRKHPHFLFNDGDFDVIQAPLEQVVIMTLLMETNFTEAELLDRPWRRCLWDYITVKNIRGHLRLSSQEEFDSMEQARKEAEAIERKMAQKKKGGPKCRKARK